MRAPVDEQPYRPLLDLSVLSAAIAQAAPPKVPTATEPPRESAQKIVELARPDVPRRDEAVERAREPLDPQLAAGRGAAFATSHVE